MEAVEALALVSGRVNEELLIRNEYLAVENKILKSKLKKPVRFKDSERIELAKIGKRMGIYALNRMKPTVDPFYYVDNTEFTFFTPRSPPQTAGN